MQQEVFAALNFLPIAAMPVLGTNDQSETPNGDLAISFVSAIDPKSFMRMPGCNELAVNQAHSFHFDGCFREVQRPEEFRHILELDAAESKESSPISVCYCEKVNSIIALTSEHCVFESIFEKSTTTTARWQSTLSFLKLKQNGSRNYEVFGTRAKAAKIKSARYLDTRFMPLGGLSVRVSPSEADTSNPPKRLTVSAEIAGEYFLKTESFKVEHRDGYLDFDRALEAAISQLKEGALCSTVEQRLVEKVRNLNGIDYKPVVGFVSELFKSEDEIIQRLGKVRERLFDSSVVVEKVLKPLMEKLNDRISNEMQKKLPMSARLELSRWKIPIELIEQQEEYVWLKRQNFQEPFSDTAEYEYGAFRQQLSGLLPTYLNKFIAMCGGKVIDEDSDEFVLLERLGRRAENKFVLIQKVTDEDPQEVWLDPEEVGT